jgi:hypothetical protein
VYGILLRNASWIAAGALEKSGGKAAGFCKKTLIQYK